MRIGLITLRGRGTQMAWEIRPTTARS